MNKKYIRNKLLVFIVACICLFVIRSYFFSLGKVDGESMYPTLNDHDYVLLNKVSYKIGEPKRFDIIMFTLPDNSVLIKRVIGLPGEILEYKNNHLYVNGRIVKESFLKEETEDFETMSIPDGEIFVMGDNRDHSTDSRVFGTLPISHILGEASFKIWPITGL
ncbi:MULTISPECIES: signal peptidase I [Niallia]|uniref:Signal peptidase I n=2 Tax=Bacillati TaxID=1783272 RepID=A0A3S2UDZ6_9BACI|nr:MULTISPECIES: signal peptidase I [Niallia]MDK8642497.1 signal peptidase I [Niallia taxi]MED4040525.1 signal peptidase I [Niallia taxi]MED4056965.1 signal peptidase I [Niallia taxi]MED4121689.1 signal peptidase I [Niallia taxi]RVT59483.1 signal peptidase I [Niallia taxi]